MHNHPLIIEKQQGFRLVRYKNKFREDQKMSFRNLVSGDSGLWI